MEFSSSSFDQSANLMLPALGLQLNVRLSSEATDGRLTLLEATNAPGFGPPLHRHTETEMFRVLEGEYLYQVADKRYRVAEGHLITVPGGVAHTFLNVGTQPARQLIIMLPAMDAYSFFAGLGDLMAGGRPGREVLNEYGRPSKATRESSTPWPKPLSLKSRRCTKHGSRSERHDGS